MKTSLLILSILVVLSLLSACSSSSQSHEIPDPLFGCGDLVSVSGYGIYGPNAENDTRYGPSSGEGTITSKLGHGCSQYYQGVWWYRVVFDQEGIFFDQIAWYEESKLTLR